MSHVKVDTLYWKSLVVVTKDLKQKVDRHRPSCIVCHWSHHVESCPTMVEIKEQYSNVPSRIANSIYYTRFEGYFRYSRKESIDTLFIYTWLLENPELVIDFKFSILEEKHFVAKYGKYVRSIDFRSKSVIADESICDSDFWRTVLYSTRNIQSLNLSRCSTTVDVLEHVGRECLQIKTINGLSMSSDMTVEEFKKLCFYKVQNVEVKNRCCVTLERFEMSCSHLTEPHNLQNLREIMPVLLQNMSNLKYLGQGFHVDFYLHNVTSIANILETSLEKIVIHTGTEDILPLLKKFCPKMNFLIVSNGFEIGFKDLHGYFPNLEAFYVTLESDLVETSLYSVLTTSVWPNLKKLDIDADDLDIELSDFAKNMPSLEMIKIRECQVRWNGQRSFKFVKNVDFRVLDFENFSWISTFANTIEDVKVDFASETVVNKDNCSSLLAVPLPNLKCLSLNYFEYDYHFITGVISACKSLSYFWMYNLMEYRTQMADVIKFIKDNNYECDVYC